MMVGCLGDVEFSVSADLVKTLENFAWKASARYGSHERHGMKSLPEFTGMDDDTVTFDVTLSEAFGLRNVQREINLLMKYLRDGEVLPLVIGSKSYGVYRWVLTEVSVKNRTTDGSGRVIDALVSLALLEYPRR